MKIKILILLLFNIVTISAFAQTEEDPSVSNLPFNQRLVFGGGFGLQFGNVTLLDLSPTIGYRLSDQLTLGTGISYKYNHIKDYTVDPNTGSWYDYASNVYGGSIWARYYVLQNIFAHAEIEQLRINYRYTSFSAQQPVRVKDGVDVTSVLVGAGYRQPLGGRVFFNILVLFNLNEGNYTPYNNPIIRAGVSVGM
jgi:hypothetical protein